MGKVFIGTSGYVYAHWRGVLYPEGLARRAWLERYAQAFDTVELNATFYRLPTGAAVDRWRRETPDDFVFACKGSRYLTHLKRLREFGAGLDRYFRLVRRLGPKLGPVLWQLPPQMAKPDLERLRTFLAHLPRDVRHVVEFRAGGWYVEETCALLERHGVAFCEHDRVERAPPRPTASFRYLRFHGTTARYAGRYGRRALGPVARDIRAWVGDVYVYFNNDASGHAVRDALELRSLCATICRDEKGPHRRR